MSIGIELIFAAHVLGTFSTKSAPSVDSEMSTFAPLARAKRTSPWGAKAKRNSIRSRLTRPDQWLTKLHCCCIEIVLVRCSKPAQRLWNRLGRHTSSLEKMLARLNRSQARVLPLGREQTRSLSLLFPNAIA